MYDYTRTPYAENRLQSFGLGASPGSLTGIMGYWGNFALRSTVKGYSNRRPGGSGTWVWFPSQQQALNYAGSGKTTTVVPPPVVVKPPIIAVKPPTDTVLPGKPYVPPIVVPYKPPSDSNLQNVAQYRIEGNVAIPLNDLARSKPPDNKLSTTPFYQWTRRVGDGAWLWKYVPPPEAVYIEPVAVRPPSDSIAPANPIVKWYNKATGEVRDARMLNAPDSSGSWILGSTAVAQGLVSAGALYGISAPGGGITVATGGQITAPVSGGMPVYTDGAAAPVTAGVGSIPTWVWLAGGAAALFFFTRKK